MNETCAMYPFQIQHLILQKVALNGTCRVDSDELYPTNFLFVVHAEVEFVAEFGLWSAFATDRVEHPVLDLSITLLTDYPFVLNMSINKKFQAYLKCNRAIKGYFYLKNQLILLIIVN